MFFLVDCEVFPLGDTWSASTAPGFLELVCKILHVKKAKTPLCNDFECSSLYCTFFSPFLFHFFRLPPHVLQKENLGFLLKTEKLKKRDTKKESTPLFPLFSRGRLMFLFYKQNLPWLQNREENQLNRIFMSLDVSKSMFPINACGVVYLFSALLP